MHWLRICKAFECALIFVFHKNILRNFSPEFILFKFFRKFSNNFKWKFITWALYLRKNSKHGFFRKKKTFLRHFFYYFLQTYMLDFREMRPQMKGHGDLYLIKQKTSKKYETKIKHTWTWIKSSRKLLVLYWYKTAGQFLCWDFKFFGVWFIANNMIMEG